VANHGTTPETTRGVASDAVTVNMVPPYILDVTNSSAATPTDTFVDYNPAGATGFTDVVYTVVLTPTAPATLSGYTVHDIVDINPNLTGTATLTTGSVYALRVASVAGTVTGGTITIDSGGLIIDTSGV